MHVGICVSGNTSTVSVSDLYLLHLWNQISVSYLYLQGGGLHVSVGSGIYLLRYSRVSIRMGNEFPRNVHSNGPMHNWKYLLQKPVVGIFWNLAGERGREGVYSSSQWGENGVKMGWKWVKMGQTEAEQSETRVKTGCKQGKSRSLQVPTGPQRSEWV